MQVFSQEGELIAEGNIHSSYTSKTVTNDNGDKETEFLHVEDLSNEELRKYWDASKILGKDFFATLKDGEAKWKK